MFLHLSPQVVKGNEMCRLKPFEVPIRVIVNLK